MLKSMTGFGVAEAQTSNYQIKIELKSLNSKFQDINVKLPRELNDKETEIKTIIGQQLLRGKIGCVIDITASENTTSSVHVDESLFKQYFDKYTSLANSVGASHSEIFRLAIQSPNVIAATEEENNIEFGVVQNILKEAIAACNEFRSKEGQELERNLRLYIDHIREGLEIVKKYDPVRTQQLRDRLSAHMDQVKEKVTMDPNRFEQEIIYYLEKLDITEEKVRLTRHLDYFIEVMGEKESQGKKLGFISQEIGREINTIGAKANDAEIQRAVVQMKDELEKIKEQSMNIL